MRRKVSGNEPEHTRPDKDTSARNLLGQLQDRLIAVEIERAMLAARIKASEEDFHKLDEASAAELATQGEAAGKAATVTLSKVHPELPVDNSIAGKREMRQLAAMVAAERMKLEQIEARLRERQGGSAIREAAEGSRNDRGAA